MLGAGLVSGERPALREWVGLLAALGGLIYLVSPGLSAPDPIGSLLMAASGVSWGAYSLWGRGSSNPIEETSVNFIRAAPLAVGISVLSIAGAHLSPVGVALAASSGAVTSGLGYVAWYAALRGLTATRAATVQLSVPVIAAAGGIVLLAEQVTWDCGFPCVGRSRRPNSPYP